MVTHTHKNFYLKIFLKREMILFQRYEESRGFPCGSDGKESACNARDLGLVPGSGRFPGAGNGHTLQYSCLENSIDTGATVHGITKSWI